MASPFFCTLGVFVSRYCIHLCSKLYSIIIGTGRGIPTNQPEITSPDEEAVIPQLDEDIIPMPFDMNKELSQIKAHRQKRQGTNKKDKYVLYILDSSGSIGVNNFTNMTNVMAEFSLLYCSGTKIAAMSYSDTVHKNYCFNCDQTNTSIRYKVIKSISFLGQNTASGDAIQYACDHMLNSPCGFPRISGQNAPEVDVIFITDGRSNQGKNVCKAAKCWSSFHNIKVFPIGIGSKIHYWELDCIKGNTAYGISSFCLRDHEELVTLLADVKEESKGGKCT